MTTKLTPEERERRRRALETAGLAKPPTPKPGTGRVTFADKSMVPDEVLAEWYGLD